MDRIISRNFRVFSHNFIAKYLHYVFAFFLEIFTFPIWIFRILHFFAIKRNTKNSEIFGKIFVCEKSVTIFLFCWKPYICCVLRRKWLRTTYTKELRTRTNSLSLSDRSKISSDWYQNQKHYQPILHPFIANTLLNITKNVPLIPIFCLGVYSADGQVYCWEFTDVAVCSQLNPLPSLTLAEDGGQCTLR